MIGAGGTGSYVLPMLVETYQEDEMIVVVDGDILEDKNLERQGFYQSDLGLNKAEALVGHYQHRHDLDIIAIPDFIRSIKHLEQIVRVIKSFRPQINHIQLMSCVDNNMVRYRMELGVYHLLQINGINQVDYIDAGNMELHGQVLLTSYTPNDVEFNGHEIQIKSGKSESIFARLTGSLEDKITYADFELSCDDIGESSPQNILTNQLAGYYINHILENLDSSYSFNSMSMIGEPLAGIETQLIQDEHNRMMQSDRYQDELSIHKIQLQWN